MDCEVAWGLKWQCECKANHFGKRRKEPRLFRVVPMKRALCTRETAKIPRYLTLCLHHQAVKDQLAHPALSWLRRILVQQARPRSQQVEGGGTTSLGSLRVRCKVRDTTHSFRRVETFASDLVSSSILPVVPFQQGDQGDKGRAYDEDC